MALVNKEKNNEKKIDILLKSSDHYSLSPISLKLSKAAYHLSNKIENNDLIAQTANQVSSAFFILKNSDSMKTYQEIAIIKYKKAGDTRGLFEVLLRKFRFLKSQSKQEEAFELYKELDKIAEKLNDPIITANLTYNMGGLFASIKDTEKAISYYNKALKLYSKINYWEGVLNCYLMLGEQNSNKEFYDLAIEYYERGVAIDSKYNKNNKHLELLLSIGNVYYALSNYEKSLSYYKEALELSNQKDYKLVLDLKNNIGVSLLELKRFKEAKPYLIEVYFSPCSPKDKVNFANNLSALYQQLGDYESAMNYIEVYIRMNDSLNNAIYSKNLSETEAKYQNEKQEEQNILLNERIKNKSTQFYFALVGILLLSGLAFFIFRGLKQKNKANLKLEEKNKIIEEKNIIVEEQHKDITDSIKYAERIQKAILPPDKLWQSILPQSFLFYQPKDILSGDFYWIEETENHIFVAAADCTGHGVPGALMSIVNYNLLNKAVLEKGLTTAGEILDGVNAWLTESLHQSFQESTVRDGMDLSLCVIDKKTKKLNFAGAFNSIYIVRNNEIEELIPDKQPVGAFIEDNIKPFTNSFYNLAENDVVYMFTDGYADQFGGPKGKKFKYKNLKNLLLSMHQKPFNNQKNSAKEAINLWKGDLEQVDDILLIGFKFF